VNPHALYTVEERIKQFLEYTIAHPFLKKVDAEIMNQIDTKNEEGVVMVFGPTGVGKTTIFNRLIRKITEDMCSELELNPDRVPVLGVELVSPHSGIFDWKDYYIRALTALEEPFKDGSTAELERRFQKALRGRRPRAFLIDEAQNLGKKGSGRRLQDQLDCIKSMSNLSEVVHVLIGTYELLPFRNLNDQLTRRCFDIHFERYNAKRGEDVKMFYSILNSFQSMMPLLDNPVLLDNADFLFERSIGCVGVLKPLLDKALKRAYREGAKCVSLCHLEKEALSIAKCTKMALAAIAGEESLIEKKGAREKLRLKLGIESGLETGSGRPAASNKRKGRVGVRNPKRDVVGSDVNGP